MYDPYAQFTKHVLSNGLEVHSSFWDRPWIGLEVIVHSGGREDSVTMPGLAHFVEHLVSKNIPHREFGQTEKFFETCGGWANFGITSYLSTRYRFRVPADLVIFREALAVFGSMIFEAQIKKSIENERKIILSEFNGRYPFLEKLEWDMETREFLFRGHRLETWNRPLGRPEGFISAAKTDLQDFYDRHYVPANVSLVALGGLHTEEIITELQKSPFGVQKNGTRNQIPKPFQIPPVPIQKTKMVKLSDYFNFKTDQTGYKATWAFPSDFQWQARRVFTSVLGKILFDEVREKRGLAYNIDADYQNFQDVCEYEISGMINPKATLYIDELVRKCIEMVPSRHDLFDLYLEKFKQKCLMIDLAGRELSENSAADLASYHRIISMQEVWGDLHKVKFEQMAEAAALLSPERQYTFISCP
jgi:predicted Zn-dependent peptidase